MTTEAQSPPVSPSYCLTVPHYNHHQSFATFLPKLASLNIPCIVVDDGSNADSLVYLELLLSEYPDIVFLKHTYNRGKGAAIFTAAAQARQLGYSHILQIDADGQHDINDIGKLISLSKQNPHSIISGTPVFDSSAPLARVYGRKITSFFVAIETLSLTIKDSLCGFRIYPLRELEQVSDRFHIGKHMSFDTDILVKSCWQGMEVLFINTDVIYIEDNVSHFDYIRDNVLLIRLHSKLLLGALIRSPTMLFQRIRPSS